jgi:hypothetical protein
MIQPTSQFSSGYIRTDALSSQASQKASEDVPSTEASDSLSSQQTDMLREALASTPEVRPEVVQRGKELAASSSYPPRVIIENLAKMLAASQDLSEKS